MRRIYIYSPNQKAAKAHAEEEARRTGGRLINATGNLYIIIIRTPNQEAPAVGSETIHGAEPHGYPEYAEGEK